MATHRLGPERKRRLIAARYPKSPEYLQRQQDRGGHVTVVQEGPGEPTYERTPKEELPALLQVVCREHGTLDETEVRCIHEHQEVLGRVSHGHRASYGGDCSAILDVHWWEA